MRFGHHAVRTVTAVALAAALFVSPAGWTMAHDVAVAHTAQTSTSALAESSLTPEINAVSARVPNSESSQTPEIQTRTRLVPFTPPTRGKAAAPAWSATPAAAPAGAIAEATATTLGPNLIGNPSFETSDAAGQPTGWKKGGYGTNIRTFTFPATPAHTGTKAAKVAISSYTSGDAKWYFDDVAVTAGRTYQFSDQYLSSVPSVIDVRYTMNDGSFTYTDIAALPASTSYAPASVQFAVPAGAVSLTIFHLIQQNGSITVDDYALQEVLSGGGGGGGDLVQNGDLETLGANGLPAGWIKGGWGTNTRSFAYPVTSMNGTRSAQVTISSYTSGDAKWAFDPVSLSPGTYTYSDQYLSTIPSTLTVEYMNSNGAFSYQDIATLPATGGSPQTTSVNFTMPSSATKARVFHLIEGVGTLTIDNASIVSAGGGGGGDVFSTGAVTLRFDDGRISQLQNAVPLLNARGFKGTFYIVSRQIADEGFTGYMSKAQVQQLSGQGHEIAAHTRTHRNLTTLTASQQQAEIQGSRQDLLGWNVGPVLSFAYPFGAYNASIINIVKNSGFSSAAATIDGDVTPSSDPYQLERRNLTSNVTVAQAKQWIDNAAANKTWLIFAIHSVDANSSDFYNVTPNTLSQIVDYIAQKSIPVVTVSQAIPALQ